MRRVGYTPKEISGWTVRFEMADWGGLGKEVSQLLEANLAEVQRVVPPAAVSQLKTVPIYVDHVPGWSDITNYHPKGTKCWLIAKDEPVEKEQSINIVDPVRFIEIVRNFYPACLLHELAHAYHDRFLPDGHKNREVSDCFTKAQAAGHALAVGDVAGMSSDRNADKNPAEYFANLTTAYFLRNCERPFDREELRAADSAGCAMLQRLWRVA